MERKSIDLERKSIDVEIHLFSNGIHLFLKKSIYFWTKSIHFQRQPIHFFKDQDLDIEGHGSHGSLWKNNFLSLCILEFKNSRIQEFKPISERWKKSWHFLANLFGSFPKILEFLNFEIEISYFLFYQGRKKRRQKGIGISEVPYKN